MLNLILQMLICYNTLKKLRRRGHLCFRGPTVQDLNAGAPKGPAYDPGRMNNL